METINTLLFVLQVLVAIALIGLVLIQHGKGADAGAAFGSGASTTVFGSRGSSNFLTKTTAVLAFVFLANSLFLGFLATKTIAQTPNSLLDNPAVIEQTTPTDLPNADLPNTDLPATPTAITEQNEGTNSDIPNLPKE